MMRADRHRRLCGSGSSFNATVVLQHTGSLNVKERQIELDRIKLADFLHLSSSTLWPTNDFCFLENQAYRVNVKLHFTYCISHNCASGKVYLWVNACFLYVRLLFFALLADEAAFYLINSLSPVLTHAPVDLCRLNPHRVNRVRLHAYISI